MTSTNGSAHRRSVPVEDVEALLCSLEGVRAASVRAHPNGSIGTISIVAGAETELSPRQIARNVQSALLARHGLLIDHRIVSVQPHPADSPAESAPRVDDSVERTASGIAPTARIQSLELERLHPHRLRCRLTLALPDGARTGEAEQLDHPDARIEVAARAALAAITAADESNERALELEGVQRVTLAGSDYVIAAVRIAAGRTTRRVAGAAPVEDLAEDAAVLAVIQATGAGSYATGHTTATAAHDDGASANL